MFAGATLPYGMAKPVADVNGLNTGGFATDGSGVTGFSAMHDSGTGGNPSLVRVLSTMTTRLSRPAQGISAWNWLMALLQK